MEGRLGHGAAWFVLSVYNVFILYLSDINAPFCVTAMLVWGTVNPVGEKNNYKGFYLTRDDVRDCTSDIIGKPVKIEHKGTNVGHVVSAWQNTKGQMDCLLELKQDNLEGAVISQFVDQGVCKELSLGYMVDVQNSKGSISAVKKHVVEVSIVKKGARANCHIHGFSAVPESKYKKAK
jgi:hypothetical protein